MDKYLKNGKPSILKFYANWCGPCRQFAPIFKEVAEKHNEKCNFLEVNVDKGEEVAKKFGVMGIPVLFMFNSSGKQIEKYVGVLTEKELKEKVTTLLKQ